MTARRRLTLWGLLFLAAFVQSQVAWGQKFNHNSYLGKKPPELVSQQEHWLGWDRKVTLEKLKGKVIWLQFNFWENCISLRPHLVRWHKQYADDGLFVIEINQFFGEPLEMMRKMVARHHLEHPVLWDDQCRNTKTYGVTSWPIAYLIGADGKVFWEGNPSRWLSREKKVKEMRTLVEAQLKKVVVTPKKSASR